MDTGVGTERQRKPLIGGIRTDYPILRPIIKSRVFFLTCLPSPCLRNLVRRVGGLDEKTEQTNEIC